MLDANMMMVIDGLVLAILIVACLRGAYIGMIRESFSIGALAAGILAVRFGNGAASEWLQRITGGEIGPGAAPWITGAVLLIVAIAIVGIVGRWIKRGAHVVGLGWADRLGGSALGVAEGALIATILVLITSVVIGRDHPALEESRSLEAVDALRSYVMQRMDTGELPDVAAPSKPGPKSN